MYNFRYGHYFSNLHNYNNFVVPVKCLSLSALIPIARYISQMHKTMLTNVVTGTFIRLTMNINRINIFIAPKNITLSKNKERNTSK